MGKKGWEVKIIKSMKGGMKEGKGGGEEEMRERDRDMQLPLPLPSLSPSYNRLFAALLLYLES